MTLAFRSHRSAVYATSGMVAASQPLAATAGLRMLMLGGNAADAAVAVAAALAVTEPCSTGLGGDAFALHYEAGTQRVTALNGSGRAPAGLTLERLRADGFGDRLPPLHAHTITVPGACAAWCDLLERHGSGDFDLAAVLADAIRLADGGFPVAPLTAHHWSNGVRQLRQSEAGAELMVNGAAPTAGQVFRNPGMAATLRAIAENGRAGFYTGAIAECIAQTVQTHGGTLTTDDLAAHTSTWDEPVSVAFRGLRVWECPPNGQGLAALIALRLLDALGDGAPGEAMSTPWLHTLIEVFRLAFADARAFITDPAVNRVPVAELLADDYIRERAALVRPDRAAADAHAGSPLAGSDTVQFVVVDGQGNACSMVNSNYMGFGTGFVPPGCGFTLQNRGANFSLQEGHANVVAPGKRPYHTIIPAIATRPDGSLYSAFGVMGGFMQPQGHVQVLLGLLDGLDPQAVLDRPRLCIDAGHGGESRVLLEEGIPHHMASRLAQMGHRVRMVTGHARATFGRGQIIVRDPATGVLCGGSDPRADGGVAAF